MRKLLFVLLAIAVFCITTGMGKKPECPPCPECPPGVECPEFDELLEQQPGFWLNFTAPEEKEVPWWEEGDDSGKNDGEGADSSTDSDDDDDPGCGCGHGHRK